MTDQLSAGELHRKIRDTFLVDRAQALELAFTIDHLYVSQYPNSRERLVTWVSSMGIDGVRYGSFKYVYKDELQHRKYDIEYWDGRISIHFTDVLHHPHLYRNIPKELI